MATSGINRISIVVPGYAFSTAAAQRDGAINRLLTVLGLTGDFQYYADYNSGLGAWGYYFYGYGIVNGIVTIGSVTCTGITNPPSGANLVPTPDPGPGVYSWTAIGSPQHLSTPMGGGGGSVPPGNNNYYIWNISGKSSAAAADFTTAVNAVGAALASSLLGGAVQKQYLKYVDSVSGAWQVSAIFFGAGCAEFGTTSTVSVLPNNNIMYVVTCSGTPHPPTGSSAPAVTMPTFTQTFTTITAPLSFGPMR